jgi:hypothetical protein
MPQKIKLKKDKPSADTLYVGSKNDPRLKAYQDSLNLYKNNPSVESLEKVQKQGVYKKTKEPIKREGIQPVASYNPVKKVMDSLDIVGTPYTFFQPSITKKNKDEYYKDEYGTVKDRKTGNTIVSTVNIYKKPVQPVVYKEEEKKIVETKEPESVVPVREEVKTMQYTGDPVYHHTAMGDKGIIGFIKDGTLTKISPEDFDRFAVPKETRQLILNKEAVDKFMESRLGKYYKR